MTDAELAAKFIELSVTRLDGDKPQALLRYCLDLERVADVAADFAQFFHPASKAKT
jgi:hypothetical protein